MSRGYRREIGMPAPAEQVFAAITTLGGLAAWWTPEVTGSPEEGGRIVFRFGEEEVTMLVTRSLPVERVDWQCLGHTRFPEWDGTTLVFRLDGREAHRTNLRFDHVGLLADCECYGMCSNGWDNYLRSLADHASGTPGSPWQPSFSIRQ